MLYVFLDYAILSTQFLRNAAQPYLSHMESIAETVEVYDCRLLMLIMKRELSDMELNGSGCVGKNTMLLSISHFHMRAVRYRPAGLGFEINAPTTNNTI